jgi:hypothetical protein
VARRSAEVLLGSSKVWARELKFWFPRSSSQELLYLGYREASNAVPKPSLFLFLNDILSSYVFIDSSVVEEEMSEIL